MRFLKIQAFMIIMVALLFGEGCRPEIRETQPSVTGFTPTTQAPSPGKRESPETSASTDETQPAPGTSSTTPTRGINKTGQGNADVLHVRAVKESDPNRWTFHVTVQHPDQGWEDYADGWDVVTPTGEVLKRDPEDPFTRLLLHPHVEEQPFTRSQSGIFIPPDVSKVRVRAHDLVDGYGGKEVVVDFTQDSGPGYEIQR